MAKEIAIAVASSLITTVILGVLGYFTIVKENQIKITHLENQLSGIAANIKDSSNSVSTLKLFVVSAHPDKNILPLASQRKLNDLAPSEIAILASDISQYEPSQPVNAIWVSDKTESIMQQHNITKGDLKQYIKVVSYKPGQ